MSLKKCIFCNQENLTVLLQVFLLLISNNKLNSNAVLKDAKYAIFKDIRPATEHHYLVIPKDHVANPKYLNKDNVSQSKRFSVKVCT